jgi:competence protein ComGF
VFFSKIISKRTLKNVKYLNENGFTLLEMLLSLSVFLILASFFPVMTKILLQEQHLDNRIQRMEWEVFSAQVKKEIRVSKKMTISNQLVLLEKDGQIISYEKYGTNIRRRVDYKGHEILLQKVQSFRFEKLKNGVRVYVEDLYGYEYEESIYSFIQMDVY